MAKRRKKKKFGKKFKTGAVGQDVERREQARSGYGYLKLPKGVPIFSPEPKSKVKLDILPYIVSDPNHPDRYEEGGIAVEGELWYKRPFFIHRGIGVDKDSVVCLKSVSKPCPICDYRDRRIKEGASYKDEDIKEIKPSKRNLYCVIPRGVKDYDEVPHIWEMSQFLFQNLLDTELKEDEEYWSFPDLEDGKTLRVRFDEGKIGDNSFAEASRIDFRSRREPLDPDIMDQVPDLDDVLEIKEYEELEAVFFEIDKEDYAEDTQVDEQPRRTKSAKPDPEPEDEWEEDEDWEEESEEFEEDEAWEEEPEFEDDWEDDEEWEDDWEDDEEWEEEEPEPEPEPKKPKRTRKPKKGKPKRTRRKK